MRNTLIWSEQIHICMYLKENICTSTFLYSPIPIHIVRTKSTDIFFKFESKPLQININLIASLFLGFFQNWVAATLSPFFTLVHNFLQMSHIQPMLEHLYRIFCEYATLNFLQMSHIQPMQCWNIFIRYFVNIHCIMQLNLVHLVFQIDPPSHTKRMFSAWFYP